MRHAALLFVMAAASLVAVLPAALPAAAQGRQAQVQLADGAGKDVVSTTCARCHGLNLITNSWGYTKDGWQELIASMVVLPADQRTAITEYLAAHYPVKPAPPGVVIAGPASVSIKEWLVPTLGQRPHDPLGAADGSIWWTGQFASRLGRLDPKTGAMKEFPLKTADSGPHGLVEDKEGHVWFTAINKAYVGRLDPKTGDVREYPLPEGRGPHTPIFDQKGNLWFTMQSGMVGRIVPSTGEVKVVKSPTANTYPYGIVINSKGVPWYVDFRGNRLGSIDPVTMVITEHALPNPETRPRRIAVTPDDIIWYTDYTRGYLGRFDPATGAVKEYPSPGGRESEPYGISNIGNTLWYSESAVRPNTLVRFDPRTEKFQSWVIPSGGGIVRHMMTNKDGNLVLACSGVNRVALVEVRNNDRTN